MAAEPLGDLADRGAGLHQAEEGATLIEVELAVGPGQRRLRRANPCKGWGFALRDRTHPLVYTDEYDIYARLDDWGYGHETGRIHGRSATG